MASTSSTRFEFVISTSEELSRFSKIYQKNESSWDYFQNHPFVVYHIVLASQLHLIHHVNRSCRWIEVYYMMKLTRCSDFRCCYSTLSNWNVPGKSFGRASAFFLRLMKRINSVSNEWSREIGNFKIILCLSLSLTVLHVTVDPATTSVAVQGAVHPGVAMLVTVSLPQTKKFENWTRA